MSENLTQKEIDEFLLENNINCWNYAYCNNENCIGCSEWEEQKEQELTIKKSICYLEKAGYTALKTKEYHGLLWEMEKRKREIVKLRKELREKIQSKKSKG